MAAAPSSALPGPQAMMPLLSLRPLTPLRPRLSLTRKAAYLESVPGCALTTGRGLSRSGQGRRHGGDKLAVLGRRKVQGFPAGSRLCGLRLLGSSSPRTRSGNGANSSTSSSHNCNTGRGGDCTPSDEDSARPRTQPEMSLIWLQVGQCGNQIGQEWWQILSSNLADVDRYPYFSRDGLINAICVDTEPKVIRKQRQQVKRGYFRDSNVIVGQRGRGNNWAYGYGGSGAGTSLLDATMEAFRRELERRDCYSGTVMLHSLCGGTGSGMGSRLCEEIRDAYPAGYILSVAAAPHETGDSPLQHYNSLLCLAWMQRFCDGVLLFQNDEVMKRAASLVERKTLTASGLQPSVSLTSMNTHIASCLAGLFCPVYSLRTRSSVSVGLEPWELIRCLCPMPTMKFLHTSLVCSRGTASWDKVTSSVVQTIPRADPHGRLHHSLSVLAVARNSQDYSFLLSRDSVLLRLRQAYRCVPWTPSSVHCWTDPQNILDPSCHSHSLTVCANHSSAADLMSGVVSKARAMYDAGAYLHWYRGYGCEDDHFHMSFDTLNSMVEEYRGLGVP